MDSSFTSAVLKTSTPLSTVLLPELKVSVKGWAEEVDKSEVIRNKVNKLWITEELKLRVDALFHEKKTNKWLDYIPHSFTQFFYKSAILK